MVTRYQAHSAREGKAPAQKSKQSTRTAPGASTQRTQAAAALQLARTDPASLRPADILALQQTAGNQAVRRLLSPAQPTPCVQLKPQAAGAGSHVTPAPAGVIQRVSHDVKERNREVFRQEIRETIFTEGMLPFDPEQKEALFKQLLEHTLLFPPPGDPLYDELYDQEEGTFAKGKDARLRKLMFPIFAKEHLLIKTLSVETKKKEWRAKYAKLRRAPIDQSEVLSGYYGGGPQEVGGICFAASIHWLSQVKNNPKYKAEDAVQFIMSESGLEKVIEIQKAHYQFTTEQQGKLKGMGSPAGLSKTKLGELSLAATEEINYSGTLDNLAPFFGFLKEKGGRLTKGERDFRFILSLRAEEEGKVGHAIGFQLRRRVPTVGPDTLQINFLDVNETVFKMKKIPLPLGSKAGKQAWAELETAITEYLERYPLLPNWSLVSYQ